VVGKEEKNKISRQRIEMYLLFFVSDVINSLKDEKKYNDSNKNHSHGEIITNKG